MKRFASAAIFAVGLILAAHADEARWPQFRGVGGSGVGAGTFPMVFGPETNVVWKIETPSGHGSPCIWSDRIFLTGYSDSLLEVLCLDRRSGARIWKETLQPGMIEHGARFSHPATATAATDGAAVYVYFGSFGLAVYDFTGKELWTKHLPTPVMQHGAGASPVIANGRIYIARDQDTESHLLCLRASDGEIIWRSERPGFKRGYATPLLFPAENPKQVILPGSLRIVSYNANDGTERWSVSGLPNELVTSAVTDGRAIFTAGWSTGSGVRAMPLFDDLLQFDANHDGLLTRAEILSGPGRQHFLYLDANKDGSLTRREYEETAALFDKSENAALAIRPDGSGDVTQTHVVWKQTRGLPYCSSPLLYQGRLFLIKNGGLATSIDAANGKLLYQEERLGALGDYYASPVAADGKICVISQAGIATVLNSSDTLQILARNELKEQVVTTPAIAANQIFIRTLEHLYAFGTGAQ